ncbi:unnamed protein product [Knipowitschia caucasica]
MSRLEQIITTMVEVFMEYAAEEEGGKKGQLSTNELKLLLEKEIQSQDFKDKINAEDIEEAMGKLDKNHDGEINFREFTTCISMLAKCYFHKKTGRGGRKGKGKGKEEDA